MNIHNINNNELGSKIKSFCNVYFDEYSYQTKSGSLSFKDGHSEFTFYLLDKLVESFSAVGELFLLSEQDRMKYLLNPTYILMRSCLTDVIILNWIFTKDDENRSDDESIKQKVDVLRKDHVIYYVSFLNKMQSLKLIGKDELKSELGLINSHFQDLLTDPVGEDLNYKKMGKVIKIAQMLNSSNKFNRALVNAYRCYSILSKVEHPGEFTRMITGKTYSDFNPINKFMISSIEVIEATISSLSPIFLTRPVFKVKLESCGSILRSELKL